VNLGETASVTTECLPAGDYFIFVASIDWFIGGQFFCDPDRSYRMWLNCVACGPPIGACCEADSAQCSVLTEADCAAAGGVYQGDGTNCTVNPCACLEDLADPPGVEQQDLNAVLNRWGDPSCLPGGASYPCPEDLAAPDGVEQQDLNAVLNRWGDPACEPN
jgi:hypothetical protein